MSFSQNAKKEIVETSLGDKCCLIAELSAIIKTAGQIEINEGVFKVTIESDIEGFNERIKKIINKLYGVDIEIGSKEDNCFFKGIRYYAIISGDITKRILEECYVIKYRYGGSFEMFTGISRFVVGTECCVRHFITGVFLGCASANIKINEIESLGKRRGGYHLEFVFNNENLAYDFMTLIKDYNIILKTIKRKNLFVCYVKEMEAISDILALVGASKSVLVLQNELTIREVRNTLNRQLNCMNANIGKTIDASLKQLDAIDLINETIGIENLPESLQELCMLRLANPEETLDNLVKLCQTPLTKSGVNHRFRKITEIANKIKNGQNID